MYENEQGDFSLADGLCYVVEPVSINDAGVMISSMENPADQAARDSSSSAMMIIVEEYNRPGSFVCFSTEAYGQAVTI